MRIPGRAISGGVSAFLGLSDHRCPPRELGMRNRSGNADVRPVSSPPLPKIITEYVGTARTTPRPSGIIHEHVTEKFGDL